ncbi:transporter substrate-binding domain-containing protein [Petroclostridium sp. X23]|uniref:transporter substrate-binding domain-containing protein n=1 Tax=Petroclostridium sp. X23 TaxID=3045146 RepID=UPI0024AD2F51|nr:transporter substrate-binding domain-containing protein [Petroclostridium sp. X23]WHH58863.1 transporter substrate-binding domain-containing protein [Petroclostridium sp. X23]
MKKRIVYIIMILILLTLVFINSFLNIAYNMNLLEFFGKSDTLTEEEREWLDMHGDIIYGSDNNAPPLRYVDEETKQYQGITIDYIRALSIELGHEIKVKPLVWEQALESLAKGETDISDMYPSEERAKHYLFSKPIYNQKGVILVPKDQHEIYDYKDLKDAAIAAQKGDYVIEFLNSKVDNIHYAYVPDYYEGIMLLKEGKVSAVVGDEPVISFLIDKLNLKNEFKILENPIYEKECILAIPKSEKMLLNIINKGIYNLNKKNTMLKIQQKWFGISAPFIKQREYEKIGLVIEIFITIILLGFYLFYSWNHQLKKEVERRTEELFISRNDLETTFDGLTHLMIVVNEDCDIIDINKSFCELMQSDKKEIIGKNCIEFPEFLCTDCDTCIIKKTFIEGKSFQNEFWHGSKIYETTVFPLKDKLENTHRALIMIKDVTNIRISEQQLLHSNKMAAIGQLAAGVAHEIRNPLGLIRNYCYLLKKNISMEEHTSKKAVNVIETSVEKASNVIENLLNFSRISGNEKENVSIRGLVDSIIKLEYKVMAKKNIREEIICDEDIVCYVNQESIKHILINLISNAIDAMSDGGVLTIRCEKKQDILSISCSDTGIGIKTEDLENIFNPFFTTKPIGQGTGLGLYIIYNEVQKFAGDIKVSSKQGEGTTFYITLPLREEA